MFSPSLRWNLLWYYGWQTQDVWLDFSRWRSQSQCKLLSLSVSSWRLIHGGGNWSHSFPSNWYSSFDYKGAKIADKKRSFLSSSNFQDPRFKGVINMALHLSRFNPFWFLLTKNLRFTAFQNKFCEFLLKKSLFLTEFFKIIWNQKHHLSWKGTNHPPKWIQ